MHCARCGASYEGVHFHCPSCKKLTGAFWLNVTCAALFLLLLIANFIYNIYLLPVVAVITAALGANLPTSVQLYANIAGYYWLLFLLAAAISVYAWRSRPQSLSFVVSGFAAVIVTLAATSYTFAVILSSLTDMVIAFPSPSLMTASRNSHTAALNVVDVANAERAYRLKYPEAGFTCDLAELGPPPSGKDPDRTSAGLITTRQAQGSWEGYEVKLSGCTAAPSTAFQLTATPVNPGVTGKSAYCSDQSGIISHTGDGKLSSCLEKLKAASELAPSPAAKKKQRPRVQCRSARSSSEASARRFPES